MVVTSIEYVANDLRKKQTQFRIGVMTVFLTVSFITFLGAISQLSPVVALKSAVMSAGDFDVVMRKQLSGVPKIGGDASYSNDYSDFFDSQFAR